MIEAAALLLCRSPILGLAVGCKHHAVVLSAGVGRGRPHAWCVLQRGVDLLPSNPRPVLDCFRVEGNASWHQAVLKARTIVSIK